MRLRSLCFTVRPLAVVMLFYYDHLHVLTVSMRSLDLRDIGMRRCGMSPSNRRAALLMLRLQISRRITPLISCLIAARLCMRYWY